MRHAVFFVSADLRGATSRFHVSNRQRTFHLASRTMEQENMFHATYSRRREKQAVARSKQIFATFAFCSANHNTHFHERKHESAGTSRNGHIDAQQNKSCRLDVNDKQQSTTSCRNITEEQCECVEASATAASTSAFTSAINIDINGFTTINNNGNGNSNMRTHTDYL